MNIIPVCAYIWIMLHEHDNRERERERKITISLHNAELFLAPKVFSYSDDSVQLWLASFNIQYHTAL